MPEFDFSSWPWLISFIAFLFILFKDYLAKSFPSLFSWLSTPARIREIEAEGERQDEVAIISAMVSLQQEIVNHLHLVLQQNQDLFNFIKDRLDKRLESQADLIDRRFEKLEQRLQDIDQRWVAASRRTDSMQNELAMLRNEVTRMVDDFKQIQNEIARIMGRD